MAIQRNRCYVCDKGVVFGNNVSHANNKTRRVWKPNLQVIRIVIEGKITKVGASVTDETWTYTASGTATAGQYGNTGTVNADDANGTGQHVSSSNPDHPCHVRFSPSSATPPSAVSSGAPPRAIG